MELGVALADLRPVANMAFVLTQSMMRVYSPNYHKNSPHGHHLGKTTWRRRNQQRSPAGSHYQTFCHLTIRKASQPNFSIYQ